MHLQDKKILTFDCYGTVIDWEQGIIAALREQLNCDTESDDDLLTLFASFETVVQNENPTWLYPKVLGDVILKMADSLPFDANNIDAKKFGQSVGLWPAFPDTSEALMSLQKHFKLVIVSNIDNESISKSAALMDIDFDYIYTAQDIGAYKPDHRVFEYVFEKLLLEGYPKSSILHVAQSLYHDHVPAYDLSLDSVWIDRRFDRQSGGATPTVDDKYIPTLKFNSLIDFATYCDMNL